MKPISLFRVLWLGLKKRCPQCGQGKLFKNWFLLNENCSHCGCEFQLREDDTYFFMYISTGFLTGLFIVSMFFVIPQNIQFGKFLVLLLSLSLFVLTHPYRKGLAVAIDYFVDCRSEFPKHSSRK
jgi:uncharacterized protein (DUF983 family)